MLPENLERDFLEKVNAFFQKVNAFFQKVNAKFRKTTSHSEKGMEKHLPPTVIGSFKSSQLMLFLHSASEQTIPCRLLMRY